MATADDDQADLTRRFGEFFRGNYARTVRLAHLLTGSEASAEDLAQESFARMHPKFADIDNPGGYLHTVTLNVCRRWHQGRFRDERTLQRAGAPGVDSGEPHHLLELIDALPYRQRAVLVLRYWLGLRESEIAQALGCRPGTVRTLHFRALANLRKELP